LEPNTAAVSSGRKITKAEAVRARRDMVYARHRVAWALDRLCEIDGARWVYDSDELGAIRRDVMTILTHHAAGRQAAMAPYGPYSSPARVRGDGRSPALRQAIAASVVSLNCHDNFLREIGCALQREPSPSMGEGWVGVVVPQYNR
jgi:hypothetical protein